MSAGQGRGLNLGHLVRRDRADTSHGPILYLEDISVSFDGFRALDALSLTIDRGELRCVIGPNGAGKTTLMDVITGKTRPATGRAYFGQTIDLLRLSETEIVNKGIGRKFQKPTVFEVHTVRTNLELALPGRRSVGQCLWGGLRAEQREAINAMLATIGLAELQHRVAGELSHGEKQWLEIGMLLMQDPDLILLDEPVAGMTDAETARTAELVCGLRGKHSIMLVEHDMDFVASIAEKVTVLHEGSVLAEGTLAQVQANPQVVEVYLGR